MTKTLAKQYKDLMALCDSIHDFSKVFEFEEKFCISDTAFRGAGWSGFSLIFVDGSIWGLSHNLNNSSGYSTNYLTAAELKEVKHLVSELMD